MKKRTVINKIANRRPSVGKTPVVKSVNHDKFSDENKRYLVEEINSVLADMSSYELHDIRRLIDEHQLRDDSHSRERAMKRLIAHRHSLERVNAAVEAGVSIPATRSNKFAAHDTYDEEIYNNLIGLGRAANRMRGIARCVDLDDLFRLQFLPYRDADRDNMIRSVDNPNALWEYMLSGMVIYDIITEGRWITRSKPIDKDIYKLLFEEHMSDECVKLLKARLEGLEAISTQFPDDRSVDKICDIIQGLLKTAATATAEAPAEEQAE